MNGRLPPCRCNLVAQTLETSDVEISESKFASGQEDIRTKASESQVGDESE